MPIFPDAVNPAGRAAAGGRRALLSAVIVAVCLSVPGPASAWLFGGKRAEPLVSPNAPAELLPALEELEDGDTVEAMAALWAFTRGRQSHEAGYSMAVFNLAEAARELKLDQLATEYYVDVVRASMDEEFTLRSLGRLESLTLQEVHDQKGIVEELVYEREFGTLPPELNNFVHYQQALMDLRHGKAGWADSQFARIQEGDSYAQRAVILRALWALKSGDRPRAAGLLEEVAAAPGVDQEVRNEARKSLARILFEQGEYERAFRIYREIEAPELLMADVILEEAWTAFHQEEYPKAMGLLVTFSAPAFQRVFKPEQYTLKALIYMKYCHYRAARETAQAFKERYRGALQRIHARQDLGEDPLAKQILEGTPAIAALDAYGRSLERQAGTAAELELPDEMKREISRLYALKRKRVERARKEVWEKEADKLKQKLFDTEEQINLLAYEAAMDRYAKVKKIYAEDGGGESGKSGRVPRLSGDTYYRFDGEYWNDELDDFTFFIEDYCRSPERWAEK